jgi:glycosyltransferase involved in cell wall biosynthesis
VGQVVASLRQAGLAVIVVDDASDAADRAVLSGLADPEVRILWRDVNGGKGAAVLDGLREAWLDGYSHVLQIDADGQHDADDVPVLVEAAQTHPDALVLAAPRFDAGAPKSRLWGRKFTALWVALETLSLDMPDTLCGFRVYPLARVLPLLGCSRPGLRMDYDVEVVVKARWEGIPLRSVPSAVRYPADGRSHFRMLSDNLGMVRLHLRLISVFLLRLPWMLAGRLRARERASGAAR